MEARKKRMTPRDLARIEIRNFIAEGLHDAEEDDLQKFEEVFDELESRYETS